MKTVPEMFNDRLFREHNRMAIVVSEGRGDVAFTPFESLSLIDLSRKIRMMRNAVCVIQCGLNRTTR